MNLQTETSTTPDPAAVFACAMSLWEASNKRALADHSITLSDLFNGMDQFMREVMRVGSVFEEWACMRIDFRELELVWPYLLQARFGDACLADTPLEELARFDDTDCLRIAIRLRLPITPSEEVRIPVDVSAALPESGSAFRKLRIQTIRDSLDGDDTAPFTFDDDPFDEEFGVPYFGIYGVDKEGMLEHIADRRTYAEAVSLAQKLAPAARFPATPSLSEEVSTSESDDSGTA